MNNFDDQFRPERQPAWLPLAAFVLVPLVACGGADGRGADTFGPQGPGEGGSDNETGETSSADANDTVDESDSETGRGGESESETGSETDTGEQGSQLTPDDLHRRLLRR
jgi:hypothetical protein